MGNGLVSRRRGRRALGKGAARYKFGLGWGVVSGGGCRRVLRAKRDSVGAAFSSAALSHGGPRSVVAVIGAHVCAAPDANGG
jgi:hypothetical protein